MRSFMSRGAAIVDAGLRTAACAAPRSITVSRSTMPMNAWPWRSKLPSLNAGGASCAPARSTAMRHTTTIVVTRAIFPPFSSLVVQCRGELGLRRGQDLENRAAVRGIEARERFALIGAAQHGREAAVHGVARLARQRVERGRVDDVAQRVTEQPRLQVEVAQRAALCVAHGAAHELLDELGIAADSVRQRRLAGEQ